MKSLEDFKKLEAEGEAIITERRDLSASELLLLLENNKEPLDLIKVCYYSGVAEGYRQAKAEKKKARSTYNRTSEDFADFLRYYTNVVKKYLGRRDAGRLEDPKRTYNFFKADIDGAVTAYNFMRPEKEKDNFEKADYFEINTLREIFKAAGYTIEL